jgi:hypothetical protein
VVVDVQYEIDHSVVVVHLVEVTLDDFQVIEPMEDPMLVEPVVDKIVVDNLMDLYEQILVEELE